jgi:hypothetical protein
MQNITFQFIGRTLEFCQSSGRPYFCLVPSFVYRKSWFPTVTQGHDPALLVPRKRYTFWSPVRAELRGRPLHERGKATPTSPFECVWFVWLGEKHHDGILEWWNKKHKASSGCTLVSSTEARMKPELLPERAIPLMHHEKRMNPKRRKKIQQSKTAGDDDDEYE